MYSGNVNSGSVPTIEQPKAGKAAKGDAGSWYGQLANAWGNALDRQTEKTVSLAQQLTDNNTGPGAALQVSAAAQQLTFLSTAASNVSNSIGQALETLGRKQ
jgi:hypothetical protein